MAASNIEWPSLPLSESLKALVIKFYEVVDSRVEGAPRRLATEVFSPTGEIFVNRRKVIGTEGIIEAQESLWGTVESRVHHIHKVYSASPSSDDLMVLGVVEWTFKNGDGRVLDGYFTSRLVIENAETDEPRIKLFQGWADKKEV